MERVNIFYATTNPENTKSINELYAEFGKEVPLYMPYIDENVYSYLCCVHVDVDVSLICAKYGYECGTKYEMDVEDYKYNRFYQVSEIYQEEGKKFELKLTVKYDKQHQELSDRIDDLRVDMNEFISKQKERHSKYESEYENNDFYDYSNCFTDSDNGV